MSTKYEFGSWPLDEVDDDATEAIRKAIQDLARDGLIVDSGRRRWSDRDRSLRNRVGRLWNLPIAISRKAELKGAAAD